MITVLPEHEKQKCMTAQKISKVMHRKLKMCHILPRGTDKNGRIFFLKLKRKRL